MGNLLASAISLVWSPVEGFFDSFGMSQSPMARGAFASLTGYVFKAVLKPGISRSGCGRRRLSQILYLMALVGMAYHICHHGVYVCIKDVINRLF
jgi:hypothetical protein